MKKYLAGSADLTFMGSLAADATGDDSVNSRDVKLLKAMLADA